MESTAAMPSASRALGCGGGGVGLGFTTRSPDMYEVLPPFQRRALLQTSSSVFSIFRKCLFRKLFGQVRNSFKPSDALVTQLDGEQQ